MTRTQKEKIRIGGDVERILPEFEEVQIHADSQYLTGIVTSTGRSNFFSASAAVLITCLLTPRT